MSFEHLGMRIGIKERRVIENVKRATWKTFIKTNGERKREMRMNLSFIGKLKISWENPLIRMNEIEKLRIWK